MADIINLAAERFARKPMTEEKALHILKRWRERSAVFSPSAATRPAVVSDVPEHLQAWRRRANWTATDVCLVINRPNHWLSSVERGQRSLRLADAQLLARLYGITVDELLKAPPSESVSG